MDVSQRRAYFASLPPDQQASQQAAWNTYRASMNRNYMRTTLRKYAVCPPQSGNALNQAYATGTQLTYNVPTAENAFLEGFFVRCALTVTLATGTSPTYGLSPSAPLSSIQEIDVLYGNIQMRFRPYILKYVSQLQLYAYLGTVLPAWPVLTAGAAATVQQLQHVATIDNYLGSNSSGVPSYPVAVAANTWNFEFEVPMTVLHPQDVRGMLPIMSGETTAQINIITASTFMGNDPILSPVVVTSGTGVLTSVTGTVQVIAYYRDGVSLLGPARQGLDIVGLPTVQWDIDPPLNNLLSGQVFRQKINKAENIAIGFLTVVDGIQATKYATVANLAELELAKDSSGTNKFWQFGLGTNIQVPEFFAEFRRVFGQDFDEGIVPIILGPTYMESDPLASTGIASMNTLPSGWTDINYGLQLTSVGSGTINSLACNPRVECHLIFVNPVGLIAG
jgi:hypothetical protein